MLGHQIECERCLVVAVVLRGGSGNRHVRGRLFGAAFAFGLYVIAQAVLEYVPLNLQFREQLNTSILVFDYRGYGQSHIEGTPIRPSEKQLRQDTEWGLTYLTLSRHIPPQSVIIVGSGRAPRQRTQQYCGRHGGPQKSHPHCPPRVFSCSMSHWAERRTKVTLRSSGDWSQSPSIETGSRWPHAPRTTPPG